MQRLRGYALLAAAGILIAWVAMVWDPVRNFSTRAGIAMCVGAFPLLLVFVLWKWRAVRWSLLVLLGLLIGVLLLPGRGVVASNLRERYVAALKKYDGTRYVWGGENNRGIDCSGLIRAAMVDACIEEGFRSFNPGLLRQALWLWWNDASAHELSLGYDWQVTALGGPMSLKEAEALMAPGDFATRPDGVHVIARLDKGDWIQADPGPNCVERFTVDGNEAREKQLALPCRWKILQSP